MSTDQRSEAELDAMTDAEFDRLPEVSRCTIHIAWTDKQEVSGNGWESYVEAMTCIIKGCSTVMHFNGGLHELENTYGYCWIASVNKYDRNKLVEAVRRTRQNYQRDGRAYVSFSNPEAV